MEIAIFFSVDFLHKQLKNLKDTSKKYFEKQNCMTGSGAAAAMLLKCNFFEQMAYLHEKSANKPRESNLWPMEAGFVVQEDEPQFSIPSPSGSVASSCSATAILSKKIKRKIMPHTKKTCTDLSESDLSKSLTKKIFM